MDSSFLLGVVGVSLLWGLTNPLLKRGSSAMSSIPPHLNLARRILAEFYALLTNWRFTLPFACNLFGSVLFNVLLSSYPLGLCVPLVNGLTCAITATFGTLVLSEFIENIRRTFFGCALIIVGIAVCLNSTQTKVG